MSDLADLCQKLLRLLTSLGRYQRHDVLLDAPDVQLFQATRVACLLTQLTFHCNGKCLMTTINGAVSVIDSK